ncbi:Npun_F0296 family exosortase-dependent surface protein [Anthocerotibacter panamensis]|uniref:Npun_F0296 family exosortase-dependent surface protein n=1 Tax=Anthocerotibacter panamensis TaxID=2857077 RepID=UPI001C407DF2|nr:hypothetical protein [Anthocerotibacter panamensis]
MMQISARWVGIFSGLMLGASQICSAAYAASFTVTAGGVTDPTAGVIADIAAIPGAVRSTALAFNTGVVPATFTSPNGTPTLQTGTTATSTAPTGDTTTYLSVGGANVDDVIWLLPGTTVLNYTGFYWGSVEASNVVNILNNGTLVFSFTGADAIAQLGVQAGDSFFVNFFAPSGAVFNRVDFLSPGSAAFEIDSFSLRTSTVPEPLSTAGLLVFGAMGASKLRGGNRRQSTQK